MNYEQALAFVLRWEGGYSKDPDDPGGETACGITHKTWERWLSSRGENIRPLKMITPQEVSDIYYEEYWETTDIDSSALVHTMLFDTGVNCGPRRAIIFLQDILGVTKDGIAGDETRNAYASYIERYGEEYLINSYMSKREQFYRSLAQPGSTMRKFLAGWLNRCSALREFLSTN